MRSYQGLWGKQEWGVDVYQLNDCRVITNIFYVWHNKKVLEIFSGDGCTTL